ncbi:hypothetical protein [Leisingera sp.]|uniref:hypothetical protein n=1 Tax=Leisingera sp. TaxID=1879318 RepID=UPI002B26E1B8|nr:hypothetical protein [Leisingera sp.]
MKRKLTVTCDRCANIKVLRRLELDGLIEIHAIAIEGMEDNRKVSQKHLPTAVVDSPFAKIGSAVIASDENLYFPISKAMTRDNHGDALHLEGHLRDGRDVFVTDDNDFLSRRDELEAEFGVTIKTADELAQMFGSEESS